MNKELFKEYLTNEINAKTALLTANGISDEDKATIQAQIDNLNAMVEKVDALEEGANANEVIDELKNTVEELGQKLTALNEKLEQATKEDNNDSKRLEMKELIEQLREVNEDVDTNIFTALSNINLNCVLGYKKNKEEYSFLDDYDK